MKRWLAVWMTMILVLCTFVSTEAGEGQISDGTLEESVVLGEQPEANTVFGNVYKTFQTESAQVQMPIVITGANTFTVDNQEVAENNNVTWVQEARAQAFNTTGKVLMLGVVPESVGATFDVYIPKDGTYYITGRAMTQSGTATDTGKNRAFSVSVEQERQEERYLEGRNPLDGTIQDDDFDSLFRNGVNQYLFGARRDYVNTFGIYEYIDARPIELRKGPAKLTIHGYTYARMDYLAILPEIPEPVESKAQYLEQYGIYEDTQAPTWLQDLSLTNEDNQVHLSFEASDNNQVAFYRIYRSVEGADFEMIEQVPGDYTSYDNFVGFNSGIACRYRVEAYDFNGNKAESTTQDILIYYEDTEDDVILLTPQNVDPESTGEIDHSYGPINAAGTYYRCDNTTAYYHVYIPEEGDYKVSGRVFTESQTPYVAQNSYLNRNIMVTVVQKELKQAVSGTNLYEGNNGKDYDSTMNQDLNKYLFGAPRPYVYHLGPYDYSDAQTVHLKQGIATFEVKGINFARLDYLAVTKGHLVVPKSQDEFNIWTESKSRMLYPTFTEQPTAAVFKGSYASLNCQAEDAVYYKAFEINSSGTAQLIGESETGSMLVALCEDQTSHRMFIRAYSKYGNSTKSQEILFENSGTEAGRDIVLTGQNFLKNAQGQTKWRIDEEWGGNNAFNHTLGKYMLCRIDTQGTSRSITSNVYIEEDANYYVYARAASSVGGSGDTAFAHTFSVHFDDVMIYVKGDDPYEGDFDNDFNSKNVYGEYLFGSRRTFVNERDGYQYLDARPVSLTKGVHQITLTGNDFARLDYLVISREPLQAPITKKQYNTLFAPKEDGDDPDFTFGPVVEKQSNGKVKVQVLAEDSGVGMAAYQVYQTHTGSEDVLLKEVPADEMSGTILVETQGGPFAALKVVAYDYNGNFCESAGHIVTSSVSPPSAFVLTPDIINAEFAFGKYHGIMEILEQQDFDAWIKLAEELKPGSDKFLEGMDEVYYI